MFKLIFKTLLLLVFLLPFQLIAEMTMPFPASIPITIILLAIMFDRHQKWSADYDREHEGDYPY